MRITRLLGPKLGSTTLLLLLLFLITGCGINPASTGAAASATGTATPRPRIQVQSAVGTIQSISGSTLLITTMQGKSIKATYSSSTRFLQQSSPAVSSLKEGMAVTVGIAQNADNTYTATRIMVTNGSARTFMQGANSNTNCLNRSQFTTSGSRRSGTTTNARGISGTIGQVNGNLLTVTDTQGSDYTMTVTSTTQIMQSMSEVDTNLQPLIDDENIDIVLNQEPLPPEHRQGRKRRQWIITTVVLLLVILVVGGGLFAYLQFTNPPPVQYTQQAVTTGNLSVTISASGPIQAGAEYDMNFTASGQVNAINVQVGQQVKAVQVLATLNSTSLQDALNVALIYSLL